MKKARTEQGHSDPARKKDMVPRRRLQKLGLRIPDYRITTIIAPAGYGKTVWASSLLDEPEWPTTVWISLDRQDAEPSILLHHLIHNFRMIWPAFGNGPALTLASVENLTRDWPIVVWSFLEQIPVTFDILLIIDDLHFIYQNKTCCAIIEFILNKLPPNVHIVLIARNNPPFKLYRQELDDELLQIKTVDLLFSVQEARSLFSSMDIKLSSEDSAVLFARTEGWAVGLRLLGIYLKQSKNELNDALQDYNQIDSSFYDYLMHEFLDNMPGGLRDFFLEASLLPFLDIRLCNAVFQRTDSAGNISSLSDYGLISPLEDEPGVWRIHHLIGAWLQNSVAILRSSDYINSLRDRVSVFFEQSGDIYRAIEQMVLAKNWHRVADLIHKYGYEYFTLTARMDVLYEWIEMLPDELLEDDCWLLYFKGLSILYIDDNRAFQMISAAADLAQQNSDLKCEACALLAMILCAVSSGTLERCESVGERVLNKAASVKDSKSRGEFLTAALHYAMATENLQEGMRLSHQAMRLKLHPELRMWANYTTSHMLFRQGRLSRSRSLIEETLAMPFVQRNERRLMIGFEVLSEVTFTMGDYQAFEEANKKSLDLASKYNMPGVVGRAYYLQAHRCYREGRLAEARQHFDLAEEYFVAGGIVHFANQVAVDMLLLRMADGEDPALLLEEILTLKTKFAELPYGLGVDYMVNSLAGIAAMEAGQLELASQLLQISSQHWNIIGAKQHQAGTDLLISHLLLLQGREKESDNLLRKALSASETWQWQNFWEWHHQTIYTMCQRALQKNICAGWAAHLLSRWFPEQLRQDLGSLLISANNQLQTLASNFYQRHFLDTGRTVLHVFFLGGFKLFANGLEVGESNWKTKKAENLFKFLVADRNLHNKEYLMQQMWPEDDSYSSDGRLRMTLSYVRKALATAGLPSDCVLVQRGIVSLNPHYEIYCDYESFSEDARKAIGYSRTGHPYPIPELEKAMRKYNGYFLPEDPYLEWTNNLRIALHNLSLELLGQLAQQRYTSNQLPASLRVCHEYLAKDPVDESIIRLAMTILWKMNKKPKAIALFHNLNEILYREYNTSPEPETLALYQNIHDRI